MQSDAGAVGVRFGSDLIRADYGPCGAPYDGSETLAELTELNARAFTEPHAAAVHPSTCRLATGDDSVRFTQKLSSAATENRPTASAYQIPCKPSSR